MSRVLVGFQGAQKRQKGVLTPYDIAASLEDAVDTEPIIILGPCLEWQGHHVTHSLKHRPHLSCLVPAILFLAFPTRDPTTGGLACFDTKQDPLEGNQD